MIRPNVNTVSNQVYSKCHKRKYVVVHLRIKVLACRDILFRVLVSDGRDANITPLYLGHNGS